MKVQRMKCHEPEDSVEDNGTMDPVKITGLFKFLIINDKAEAVYAMVLVPCKIMKASK